MDGLSPEFQHWLEESMEARAFTAMRDGQRVPLPLLLRLGMRSLWRDPLLAFLRNYPGGIGMQLRAWYYRSRLREMGRCVLIDEVVRIEGPEHIAIGDFVWVDQDVRLSAPWGSITIGQRVHVADHVLIAGGGHVVIGDYAAIARGASLYSHSEAIIGGKRLSGPMVPEAQKGMRSAPIVVGKDALVGVNAVVLPGVTIGEGAIVGANALVNRDVGAWDIVFGSPARVVAKRPKVTVGDR